MIKRSIVFLCVMILMAGLVQAQVKPVIKAGFNLSNIIFVDEISGNNAEKESQSYKMKPGFEGGIFADWPITEHLTLQPGFQYSMQGFTDKYKKASTSYQRRFTLSYLQIPINVQYKMKFEYFDLLYQAGPYLGYCFAGKHYALKDGKSVDLSDSQKKIEVGNGDSNELYNAYDFGVGAAVGIDVANFQIMVGYNLGLYKMRFNKNVSQKYDMRMNNQGISITFAYVIGRRKDMPIE